MKTRLVVEQELFVLVSSCYNSSARLRVTKRMLEKAPIGKVFTPERSNSCGRDVVEEELKVIYKDSKGVACILSTTGTTDSPNPEDVEEEDEIIWFSFLD